ncbi:MAG: type II toxin-antitoxin system Phd/YefM family antitoxin [Terriglobales bacterium]
MDTIAVSEFKATCAEVLERVRKSKRTVTLTRFGKPVAQRLPPTTSRRRRNWLGCMARAGAGGQPPQSGPCRRWQ